SGALSTAVMVAAYKLSAGSASKYFSAALGLAISTTTISYLFVFPSLVKLRRSLPLVERPYRIPGGMAGVWICCLLATGGALLATVTTIWPGIGIGWFHTSGAADSALPQGFEGQRAIFEATQLAPLAFALLLGLIFYVFGAPARRRLAADAALGDSVIPERGA
ncbi:MAG TPA: hypothetical protein VGS41_12380, partial [Chthonomonadales bacterium]|nr:hypothetical protein [Chthonomonadales bacterium]